jgi:hypothetical protein
MITSRRTALKALLGSAALVLDPEKLLWKPGKLISIPARYIQLCVDIPERMKLPHDAPTLEEYTYGPIHGYVGNAMYSSRVLRGSIEALKCKLNKESRGKSVALVDMPLIPGLEACLNIATIGGLSKVQFLRCYDVVADREVARLRVGGYIQNG